MIKAPEANFIYVIVEGNSEAIYQSLLKEGVIVRPMGRDAIRVTIGLPKENKKLILALKKIMRRNVWT
ncbi:MAG: hypothetical protein HY805_09940 [Nitrospirae bacterium]|nr:hypothetical protein [Nitrospirota bacterium]